MVFGLLLAACQPAAAVTTPTETPAASPADNGEDVLYVNLTWHQHQPLYYKNDEGVYTRPWVRVHATKDYYDMAAMLKEFPQVHATFNLTPVLIRQLDDFTENGAKDLYWQLAEVPADQLSDEQKEFILTRFFDANWDNIIARFPRYQELLNLRGGTDETAIAQAMQSYSEADFRDLQVWFNLAWFDLDFLAAEPLKSLVEKGRDFSEADKEVVFEQVRAVMANVIAVHKELQASGQIEVITTPYAHPILPLIYNSDLAAVGNPTTELPERFSWPNDAIAQLARSVEVYEAHFDQAPRGLWPGEGAVAQEIVPLVAQAGYQWMASGEPVLAASLGMAGFTRNASETVLEADTLYRPYVVQGEDGEAVTIFFRDGVLSDKIGFTYSQTDPQQAAADLMARLENIRAELKKEGAQGPHIVSIILDGENAWEYYPNDGKDFLRSMYQAFSDSRTIRTITPSEYLEKFPQQRALDDLFPGAWFSPNYDTWIGEDEENRAWDYLGRTRAHLAKYDVSGSRTASVEAIALAQDYMYLAEGSDWFWWYGADQNSGQDTYFDESFRALQMSVYQALGDDVPDYLYVPIIPPAAAEAARAISGSESPKVDGLAGSGEWNTAALYGDAETGGMGHFYLAQDNENLYLRLDQPLELLQSGGLGVYLNVPGAEFSTAFLRDGSGQSGLSANYLIELDKDTFATYRAGEQGWESAELNDSYAWSEQTLEIQIGLAGLGDLEEGDAVRLRLVSTGGEMLPAGGPAELVLRQIGSYTTVLEVNDPLGDDHGPGTYTYPTDTVFEDGVFDLTGFKVMYDENYVLFEFNLAAPISNPWDSPNGLALQTLDVYVDTDPGAGSGARLLLPGRNAALGVENGWDVAVWAEGWYPQILQPNAESGAPEAINATLKILVDAAAGKVTLRVPREIFGEGNPADWGYAAAVLSQDGYPSTGVWRVRDVQASAAQWRLGGAPEDSNHTRIIDLVWAGQDGRTQADILSNYAASNKAEGELGADDFVQIPLLFSGE
jgi:alpha-amylase/alpha-mannosidase (GH57 family)